jgi:hypothetical protein
VGWTFASSSVGDIQVATARLEQVHLQRSQVEQAVKADVGQGTHVDVDRQRARARRAPRCRCCRAVALAQPGPFKNGAGLELEVIEAQESLTAARTALVDAIVAYNVAQVGLLRAIGAVSAATLRAGP